MVILVIALLGYLCHGYGHLGHVHLFGRVLSRVAMAIAKRDKTWPNKWLGQINGLAMRLAMAMAIAMATFN